MAADDSPREFPELAAQNRDIWDANAEWWDDRIGDGNDFQTILIEPATERLLQIRPGDLVLDIACGAGRFARRMAELGARVIAVDHSSKFIDRARTRTPEGAGIEFQVMDAGDRDALLVLGRRRFDKAVCTMALMDMPVIEPMMSVLPDLLKPGGRFVYSICHPCFNTAPAISFSETREDEEGRLRDLSGVKVTEYLTPSARKTEGIRGQPVPQDLYHRPLHLLFGTAFQAGFVLDGLEEPRLRPAPERRGGAGWAEMPEIPPVLVVRLRCPLSPPTRADDPR